MLLIGEWFYTCLYFSTWRKVLYNIIAHQFVAWAIDRVWTLGAFTLCPAVVVLPRYVVLAPIFTFFEGAGDSKRPSILWLEIDEVDNVDDDDIGSIDSLDEILQNSQRFPTKHFWRGRRLFLKAKTMLEKIDSATWLCRTTKAELTLKTPKDRSNAPGMFFLQVIGEVFRSLAA